MKHRDCHIVEAETLHGALTDTFKHAYAMGRSDAINGVHVDPNLLAEIYIEDLPSDAFEIGENLVDQKPVYALVANSNF